MLCEGYGGLWFVTYSISPRPEWTDKLQQNRSTTLGKVACTTASGGCRGTLQNGSGRMHRDVGRTKWAPDRVHDGLDCLGFWSHLVSGEAGAAAITMNRIRTRLVHPFTYSARGSHKERSLERANRIKKSAHRACSVSFCFLPQKTQGDNK